MTTPSGGPSPVPPSDGSQGGQLLAEAASGLAADGEGPDAVSAETQTAMLADAAVQYEPPASGADAVALAGQLASDELADFLREAVPRCEAALQQNELLDVLADELSALAEDEGEAGPCPGASASGRAAAMGLTETHTFSDLVHSKGRTLTALAWHPGRRGVVAVACTQQPGVAESAAPAAEPASSRTAAAQQALPRLGRQERGGITAAGRAATAGVPAPATAGGACGGAADHLRQPPPGCILIWSHMDAVHPELVLQPPAQTLTLAFNPSPPHSWLAAGLSTGQVSLFNLQQLAPAGQAPAAAASTAAGSGAATLPATAGEGPDEASHTAPLAPAFVSSSDACHQAPITGLHWLPGVLVTKDGQLEVAAAPAAHGDIAAGTAPASIPTQAAACNLFATTSADGSLLVWDARISTRPRNTRDEETVAWKPALALAPGKPPLMATRFCPDPRSGSGRFLLGSLEGELALTEAALSLQEKKSSNATEWMLSTLQLAAGHTGRVQALAFSPFFSDILLVVGDSGFVVWRAAAGCSSPGSSSDGTAAPGGDGAAGTEACLVAVFESPFCAEALYTCGCWSPSKPGVVVMGRADGRLEAWDLLDRCHQPAMVALVAPCALTTLAAAPPAAGGAPGSGRSAAGHHQLLAVGDAAGTLRLLELPGALRRRCHAEVRTVAALLAREQERLGEAARRAEERAALAREAAERERTEAAAAAIGALRRAQQEAAASAARAGSHGAQGEEESPEAEAERRYLAVEREWRQRLLGGMGGVADTATVPLAAS